MLKMYQQSNHKGDTPELWEENWENNDFEQALRFCEVDPLRPLFEKYAPPGSVMLEGGCGNGQYVAFHAARGVQVTGLDFAQTTLHRLHSRKPDLNLCAGDVAALPFRDEMFDIYYSGGVVEHFEGGPETALREARRVVRRGGIFLCSVPYFNLLRRVMLPFRSNTWRRTSLEQVRAEAGNGLSFFQYVYSRSEFERKLKGAGWRVIGTQGYALLWGLYDAPYVQKVVENRFSGAKASTPESNSATAMPARESNAGVGIGLTQPPSLVRRLVVAEDDTVPIAGLGIRLMRRVCANMMMYVCVRD
jgi:SAM-dependent methyltransferase